MTVAPEKRDRGGVLGDSNPKDMFLKVLWKRERGLALVFSLFIIGQAFFSYKGVETFPFLHWGMFSERYKPQLHETYHIHINGEPLNCFALPKRTCSIVRSKIAHYHSLKKSGFKDPIIPVLERRLKGWVAGPVYQWGYQRLVNHRERYERFPAWLRRYLSYKLERRIRSLKVECRRYTYSEAGRLSLEDTEQLFVHGR